MHHLFCGHDVGPLANAPFESKHNQGHIFGPDELHWNVPTNCRIEFLPNISHFIGSDILCGIQATRMLESEKNIMLIDLGTNGEIVLGNKHSICCTSTAAGPAFEGINISCGMRASLGAVYAVDYLNEKFNLKTIGDMEPRGICGSGLVEAIHSLYIYNYVDSTGVLNIQKEMGVSLSKTIRLTAADIREFQLAKGALGAAISILMKNKNVFPENINTVYLSGGLGHYLNINKARQLGLFAQIPKCKILSIGNSALTGCVQFLFNSNRGYLEAILQKISFCQLETDPYFTDYFCKYMFLGNKNIETANHYI